MSSLEEGTFDHAQIAQVCKALSDETRQRILLLLRNEAMNVGQIVENFTLAQPTISRHLAVLRQAGLVKAQRSRQQMIYSLVPAAIDQVWGDFSRAFCDVSADK
jgi:ArsR family transcriptional regulator, arsenate/arsenite/antimonite-responsive transcriptional repressor